MSVPNRDSLPKKLEEKTSSPFSKKLKLSDSPSTSTRHARPTGDVGREEVMESQIAEPPTRRALNLPPPPHQQADLSAPTPPQCFVSFFADFERRLDTRIQCLLDDKLGDLKVKVREHEDKIRKRRL